MLSSLKKNQPLQLFLLFALLQIILTIFTGIHEDEPYYWDWTRFLSFGYFDHPPMVAWCIKLMQPLFGMGPLAFKMGAALGSVGTVGALWMITKRFSSGKTPLAILIAIYLGTPVFGILSKFMTPDIPLFLFWALSLYLGYRISEKEQSGYREWLLLGVTTGLGMYSKYTFILFFPSFALLLLISRRDLLKSVKPYLSLGTAILIGIPHLIWNYQNGWPSIAFQMDHGLGATTYQLKYLGEYIGSQVGMFNPLLFVALVIAVVLIIRKYRKNPALLFLTITTLFPLFFFAYSNLKKRGNANWASMAFLSGAVLIVWLYENSGIKMKRYLNGALIFGVAAVSLIVVQMITPVLPVQSVVSEIHGWKDLGRSVDSLVTISQREELPIMANSYQMAGTLGLTMKKHPRVYAINLGARTNHYAFLPERKERISGEFLYFHKIDSIGNLRKDIQDSFSDLYRVGTTTLTQGTKVSNYGLYIVRLKNPEKVR